MDAAYQAFVDAYGPGVFKPGKAHKRISEFADMTGSNTGIAALSSMEEEEGVC